ncbi:rhombosortase [Photobacterium sp.]|uniref:rhombosortase n=1 Tax=Photobacterium sp. TaxID=660 RepID=UPI00299ECF13|nr:rhombosortase [Photobacterium sp.]MDX1303706.1 rhombosortase [Photobacterium sp.]
MSIRTYLVIAISLSFLAQWPVIQSWIAWDRETIAHGEIWRILTGNLTHTNWPHMVMNSLALIVITFIFRAHFCAKHYTVLILLISLVIGIGLFATDIQWYAGLSGVLHGLFAWGAVRDLRTQTKGGWLLLAGLTFKIGWEQYYGGAASSAALIGARVAIEAHLIGAVTGLIAGYTQRQK